jgi:hypothetical protein
VKMEGVPWCRMEQHSALVPRITDICIHVTRLPTLNSILCCMTYIAIGDFIITLMYKKCTSSILCYTAYVATGAFAFCFLLIITMHLLTNHFVRAHHLWILYCFGSHMASILSRVWPLRLDEFSSGYLFQAILALS